MDVDRALVGVLGWVVGCRGGSVVGLGLWGPGGGCG